MSTGTAPVKTNTKPPAGSVKTSAADMAKWETPTNKAGLESLAPMVKDAILKALPSQMNKPEIAERLVRCLITECQTNARLLECTPLSLFGCCIKAAQLGLEIGGPLGRAYLVPFKNNKNRGLMEAQLIPGYKGLLELAHRSGMIKRITPVTVREGDEYLVIRGLEQNLIHKPKRGNLGRATDYYVAVQLISGGLDFEEFTVEQAVVFRNRYALARSGPWFDIAYDEKTKSFTTGHEFDKMAEKTLIRRISNRIPMSTELAVAIGLEDNLDRGIPQLQLPTAPLAGSTMPDLLGPGPIDDEEPKEKDQELKERLDAAKGKEADGGANGATEGGVQTASDSLSDAIKDFADAGGIPEELAEQLGSTLAKIRSSTGKDRGKFTSDIIKATNELGTSSNTSGTLPGMKPDTPPKH